MRRFISLLAFAGALVFVSPAAAQIAPPPKVILTSIDHVPMFELYDGGGGLPHRRRGGDACRLARRHGRRPGRRCRGG